MDRNVAAITVVFEPLLFTLMATLLFEDRADEPEEVLEDIAN